MRPIVFLGGAIAGAIGLAAAAMHASHRAESQHSPLLKTSDVLDADDVVRELNNYSLEALSLCNDCTKVVFDSGNTIFTPAPLPWDKRMRKTPNRPGDGGNGLARKNACRRLRVMKEEVADLYEQYRSVFMRANDLVAASGGTTVSLEALRFDEAHGREDNSTSHENQEDDVEALADCILKFLETSCDAASRLIDMIQGEGQPAGGQTVQKAE